MVVLPLVGLVWNGGLLACRGMETFCSSWGTAARAVLTGRTTKPGAKDLGKETLEHLVVVVMVDDDDVVRDVMVVDLWVSHKVDRACRATSEQTKQTGCALAPRNNPVLLLPAPVSSRRRA